MCARLGFREAAKKADPVLLEPIMAVEVTSPEEFIGSVTGDLNKRRGIMKGIESKGNGQIVKADVPLAELFGYVTDLRTITSGRAAASLTFLKYEIVPKQLADKIIDKVKNNN
jgi:elongation factor G